MNKINLKLIQWPKLFAKLRCTHSVTSPPTYPPIYPPTHPLAYPIYVPHANGCDYMHQLSKCLLRGIMEVQQGPHYNVDETNYTSY